MPQFRAVRHLFRWSACEVQQGGSTPSHSATGLSGTCPLSCSPCAALEDFGVKRVDGILGTTLFYHSLPRWIIRTVSLSCAARPPKAWSSLCRRQGRGRRSVLDGERSLHGGLRAGWPLFRRHCSSSTQDWRAPGSVAGSVISRPRSRLRKQSFGRGGEGGTLKIVPYTVSRASFGGIQEDNVPGLYDGPFPWDTCSAFTSRA